MKVFISYDFNHLQEAGQVERWVSDAGYTPVMLRNKRLHPESDQQGRNKIKDHISGCRKVLVLVGDNTHNRPWVDYEVSVAVNKGKTIVPVRLTNTRGAAPRELRNKAEISFSPIGIKSSL